MVKVQPLAYWEFRYDRNKRLLLDLIQLHKYIARIRWPNANTVEHESTQGLLGLLEEVFIALSSSS